MKLWNQCSKQNIYACDIRKNINVKKVQHVLWLFVSDQIQSEIKTNSNVSHTMIMIYIYDKFDAHRVQCKLYIHTALLNKHYNILFRNT